MGKGLISGVTMGAIKMTQIIKSNIKCADGWAWMNPGRAKRGRLEKQEKSLNSRATKLETDENKLAQMEH